MTILFKATNLTKRYGPVTVLDGAELDVRYGEIHALLGANGAGKSTLCKIIAGLVPASTGEMTLAGADYQPANKQAAENAGIEIVQQELNQIATLTVAENILLTRMPRIAGVIRRQELASRARRALDRFGLHDIAADAIVGTLGVGRQQMIEIATALDRSCQLLILDEPTAALSSGETQRLFECLHSLRTAGIGIIYISHRLDEVAQMADRVTVLRDGKTVATRDTRALSTEQMVALMSGDEAQVQADFQSHATESVAFRAHQISGGIVQAVNFAVHRGERLGIAGLVGSGRTELLRLLFGAETAETGTVQVGEAQPTRCKHPRQAVVAGLAMVTEDRKQNGLLLHQSIRVNTTLSALGTHFASLGILRRRRECAATAERVEQLETRCNNIEQAVATLSGGNQQKVAVSKWLIRDAQVFLFDEPTRGIDVSARRRIYRLVDSLAAAGKSIIIVSSDLEELMETCDRIGVMSNGRWVHEFTRPNWSSDQIMQSAFSAYLATEAIA
ncbi:sugar ABC transporter ATP-binding protein [Aureliella helgolandensis]|uniref:Ribose import ATP-binding protein RbsA n=1 Tax=Aureliella helgolandensis TaxID=2527968 RepID=A0A518GC79_9BACT|nr:sugar ABC transporter ATP-binding protein [Aureliella helgolandensis]QDV26201.1 Ribose import ATP-binding protein RbsA [Aureliella helgolandensis]